MIEKYYEKIKLNIISNFYVSKVERPYFFPVKFGCRMFVLKYSEKYTTQYYTVTVTKSLYLTSNA